MSRAFGKEQKINTVLVLYEDFLVELFESLSMRKEGLRYETLRDEAYGVLDRNLSVGELSAMLAIEGGLKDAFPGVRSRIRVLLRKEITCAVLGADG